MKVIQKVLHALMSYEVGYLEIILSTLFTMLWVLYLCLQLPLY